MWQNSGPLLILTNLKVNLNQQSGVNISVESLRGQLSFGAQYSMGTPIVEDVELAGMSVIVDTGNSPELDVADNTNNAIHTFSHLFHAAVREFFSC